MKSSFSRSLFGVSSRINNPRWALCMGGSIDGSWSLNGSSSRCCSIRSLTSSPSRPSSGTGKPGNGPVVAMHDENVSGSVNTEAASS